MMREFGIMQRMNTMAPYAHQIHYLKSLSVKPVLYVGEVGKITTYDKFSLFTEASLYKYGITNNAYRRIVYSHMKRFDYFDLVTVKETENHRLVEKLLTQDLKKLGMHVRMDLNGHVHRELFYLKNPATQMDWLQSLLDELVLKASIQTGI